MTGEVTSLDEFKQSKEPHCTGPAVCMDCKHEWQFVCPYPAPATFDCPECGLTKGRQAGLYIPNEDEKMFICNCGNDRVLILTDCIFCEMCGVRHDRDMVDD